MPDIITVGEILVEIMAKEKSQTFLVPGEFIGPYPSGAPAIFIDQAARMGAKCGIVSKVGQDDFGNNVLIRLRADGVDTSEIKTSKEHTTGTAFVTYFHDGSRQFIFHLRHSASGFLEEEDINERYFKDCRYLHIMGCSITASDQMRKAILKATRISKKFGAAISFDPNIRPELMENDQINKVFREILSMTDILLTGESEIEIILNKKPTDIEFERLLQQGIRIIVLKKGSKGIEIMDENIREFIAPIIVQEVDPTGAGDCFDGAFLAMLNEGKNVFDAAVIANAAGALSVTKQGPMEGAHFKEQIYEFLKIDQE